MHDRRVARVSGFIYSLVGVMAMADNGLPVCVEVLCLLQQLRDSERSRRVWSAPDQSGRESGTLDQHPGPQR